MAQPIPDFDHNLVIPPHLGNPAVFTDLSPYPCTTLELCIKLGSSPKRKEILRGYLEFREKLYNFGLLNGFQWLDGSFLEDVETRELRPPNDLDIVTIYWGYDITFQNNLVVSFPEFADSQLAKKTYSVDHYPFDAGHSPKVTVDYARYWVQLFSHNRDAVWKGMLQISLNTPNDDKQALALLNS